MKYDLSGHIASATASRIFWWVPFGTVPEVSPSQLMKELKQPQLRPQLLDVRTEREWRYGHIKDSLNIPITRLPSAVRTLPFDPNRPVVTICFSAHRSIPALRILRRHGFQDVVQLAGGMRAWRRESLPEET